MKPIHRPVYLDLVRIHLPLPGWVSILHRVSGVLLVLAFPVAVSALAASLSSEAGFQRLSAAVTHPLGKLTLLLLAWGMAHHFFAGLRHLALDAHWGVAHRAARATSLAVMLSTAVVVAIVAWSVFR